MKMTVDTSKARKRLKRYRKLDKAILFNMQDWTSKTVKKTKTNIMRVIFKSRKGRTGALARSIAGKVYMRGNLVISIIGSGVFRRKPVKYARIQEKGSKGLPGGVVRPKKAKMLTIPLPGVQGRAANFPDAFIIKSKKGNILLVERKGKKGLKPLFVLKREVDIPARHWLETSIDQMKLRLYQTMKAEEILKTLKSRSL